MSDKLELIRTGLRKYDEGLTAGMTTQEAKQYAYSEIPALRAVFDDRTVLTHWGRGIKAVNESHGIKPREKVARKSPPKTAVNGQHAAASIVPGAVRVSGIDNLVFGPALAATDFTCYMFDCWLKRTAVSVGSIFEFDLDQWHDVYQAVIGKEIVRDALVNAFYSSQKSKLQRQGWGFDITRAHPHITVTVTQMPLSPPPALQPAPSGPLTDDEMRQFYELLKKVAG